MAKPYGLWKRANGVYYYRFGHGSWHTTGRFRQDKAIEYALERLEEAKQKAARRVRRLEAVSLREPSYSATRTGAACRRGCIKRLSGPA
jgi:hypothetical protein